MSFYHTLNQALEATDPALVTLFPVGWNLNYGQTIRCVKCGVFFSVYRDECGMYEEAIMCASKCEDFVQIISGE